MKVLFAGPSLYGADYNRSGLDVRPPARQGDLHRAVLDGATAIGLIDGVFGFVPSVWHKEILFALKAGVHVLGAASLGALRAAECADFGMEPVGTIALSYLDGERIEDGDVCLAHAPEEMAFMPLERAAGRCRGDDRGDGGGRYRQPGRGRCAADGGAQPLFRRSHAGPDRRDAPGCRELAAAYRTRPRVGEDRRRAAAGRAAARPARRLGSASRRLGFRPLPIHGARYLAARAAG